MGCQCSSGAHQVGWPAVRPKGNHSLFLSAGIINSVSLCLAFLTWVLGFEFKSLCLQDKHFIDGHLPSTVLEGMLCGNIILGCVVIDASCYLYLAQQTH